MEKIGDKYAFRSHHGRYISAQPQGGLQVNRDSSNAWERFVVLKKSTHMARPVLRPRSDPFPCNLPGSVWTWAHGGTKPNGIIEFLPLPVGGVKWGNGARQGSWQFKEGGTVLETEFNGVLHELEYVASEKKAVLRTPQRTPPSQMWIQGDRG